MITGHATVLSVSRNAAHRFSKAPCEAITLLSGLGVEGDAHAGITDQHRFTKRRDPTRPNLRQVHLIQSELFAELADRGFEVGPGELGENVTTRGIDLLALPERARLHLGGEAVVEVTGLRNPCKHIDGLQAGLLKAVIASGVGQAVPQRTGVMSIVIAGGVVRPGDAIRVELPVGEHRMLQTV
ncbi:MOSC domain-containing protein [Lysobacter korlensis]|uniref:MOSC domain-containing protein n=1 Tax=Lysobacter korlensis TaxID=553636 RepID=A0ABV6RTB1_9GAMM